MQAAIRRLQHMVHKGGTFAGCIVTIYFTENSLKITQNFTENGGRATLGPTPKSTYESTRRAILILLKHA